MFNHLFNNNQPVYIQIMQRIYASILSGEYKPGSKLPSVIESAMLYKVNHNTIARVYSELVRSGVAIIRRGEGTFVTEEQSVIQSLHQSMKRSLIVDFVQEMRSLGYDEPEILEEIKMAFEEPLLQRNEK